MGLVQGPAVIPRAFQRPQPLPSSTLYPCPRIQTKPTNTLARGMSSSDRVLDIFEPFLPSLTQHVVLNAAQRVLEDCFYEFVSGHMPSLLCHQGWECSVAVELTEWVRIFRRVVRVLPSEARSDLEEVFRHLSDLRNTAVHRRPISKNGAEQQLRSALQMTQLLQSQLGTGEAWWTTKLQEFQRTLSGSQHTIEDAVWTASQSSTSEVHGTAKDHIKAEGSSNLPGLFGQGDLTAIHWFMEAVRRSASRPEELFFGEDFEDGVCVVVKNMGSYSKYYTWSPEELRLRHRLHSSGD